MTTIARPDMTTEDLLDATRALAPAVARRAAEIERARRVPRDLLDELHTAGCFRMLRPRSHGGIGAAPSDAIRVLESLARSDASVAWTVMVGGGGWIDLAGLPRDSFDAVLRAPDVVIAGVFNPSGSIAAVPGGYRVTGRWSFASGCEHADWIYGNCIEDVAGAPAMRTAVFTPDQITIEDTWTVSGLCGTGSHHFRVDDVVVPAERTCRPMEDPPCIDEPVLRIPIPPLLSLLIAGVALGTAHGALDDVHAMSAGKVPLLSGAALAANPHFRFELATADTELRAARALLHESARAAWASVVDGEEIDPEQHARMRATAVWVTARSVAVVESSYRAGGGTSIYADCPLQRRLRDVQALSQHFLVRPDTLTTAGAVLTGQDIDVPVF